MLSSSLIMKTQTIRSSSLPADPKVSYPYIASQNTAFLSQQTNHKLSFRITPFQANKHIILGYRRCRPKNNIHAHSGYRRFRPTNISYQDTAIVGQQTTNISYQDTAVVGQQTNHKRSFRMPPFQANKYIISGYHPRRPTNKS